MGIQGLIPFLDKASKPVNVREFSGNTVAIDAYCWLHKGVFSCADKLARDEDCDSYVVYCMKFVNMLLSYNIKPILVFDGQKLPAKSETEKKRRLLREQNRKRAAELMRLDRGKEALTYLRRCIDITHKMALNLIRVCRSRNVDCIVAPYEADAQLAYLNLQNIAQVIITEDSDLLLFGAKKVLFKMDTNGNGLMIEQDKLHVSMGLKLDNFSFDKFRYMCILSGCDYLSSLPGIGLAKACRFITRTVDPDIYRAISRISSHLNMPQLIVTKEYRDNFMAADFMFKHQPVFDPVKKKLVPLTPVSSDDDNYKQFLYLVTANNLSDEQICHLAYGNLDPLTLLKLDNWTPASMKMPNKTRENLNLVNLALHPSIWEENFVPFVYKPTSSTTSTAFSRTCSSNVVTTKDIVKYDWRPNRENLKNYATQFDELKSFYQHSKNESHNVHDTNQTENKKRLDDTTTVNYNYSERQSKLNRAEDLKNTGALSKFVSLCNSAEHKKSLNVVSRYFVSFATSDVSRMDIDTTETKTVVTDQIVSLSAGNGSEEKIVQCTSVAVETQRSPLKIINDGIVDKMSHVTYPTDSFDEKSGPQSTNGDSKMSTTNVHAENAVKPLTTKIKKRTNPFAITTREKSACIDSVVENSVYNRTTFTPIHDAKRIKTDATFKWAETCRNGSTYGGNGEGNDDSIFVKRNDFKKLLLNKCKHEKKPSGGNYFVNSIQFSTQKNSEENTISCSRNCEEKKPSFSIRPELKCRTPGLTKKPMPKQPSLFSMFAYRKPEKLKI